MDLGKVGSTQIRPITITTQHDVYTLDSWYSGLDIINYVRQHMHFSRDFAKHKDLIQKLEVPNLPTLE